MSRYGQLWERVRKIRERLSSEYGLGQTVSPIYARRLIEQKKKAAEALVDEWEKIEKEMEGR